MNRKVVSLVVAVALLCCLYGTSTYAKTGSDPKEPKAKSETPAEKTQAQEKLKADMTKLVSDAKAGKLKMPAPQFPQPQRNNLSTGAKIGIVAAIAGAIVLIAILVHVTSDN
jgi:hypothetical protein